MYRIARLVRRTAQYAARRSWRAHAFLCAAGFNQALLDPERLRNTVERRESLFESDHTLIKRSPSHR